MQAVVQRTGWLVPVILVLGALGLGASYGVAARSNPRIVTTPTSFAQVSSAITPMSIAVVGPEIDPAKVQGPDACGACHTSEMNAWEQSTHKKTYDIMHRTDKAKDIRDALDLKGRIRLIDLCSTCHYTSQIKNDKRKSIEGVSCESCHGPGKDWNSPELHHGKPKDDQTPEQREAILKACEEAGMLRPKNIYLVATNCYSCHTVPNEKLVNVGGHPAASNFELVSWSQGEVRHSFQYSPDQKNREASAERKRVLYVVGALTDYEYSLRALSRAKTPGGKYAKAMEERVACARKRLEKIQAALAIDEVRQALTPDADNISAAAKAFVNNHDGSDLAALDSLIPRSDQYKGEVQP